MGKAVEIQAPELALKHCSVDEHAHALRRIKRLPFWWYQGDSKLVKNYSVPFQDRAGNWWYEVKPGWCWPVDFFRPIDPAKARLPYTKSFLGWQFVVAEERLANCRLVINTIRDLTGYSAASIESKRRNAVRKGLKSCRLSVVEQLDDAFLGEALSVWNDLTIRTGWKHVLDRESFCESWRLLAGCPGVTIIAGHDVESGRLAGFLVTKIIGETAYVDTIASCSELLNTNVNDLIMYAFVANASKIPGVTMAHYAIKSNVTTLEHFKHGMGFEPYSFPARARFRKGMGRVMHFMAREKFERMMGIFPEEEETKPAETPKPPAPVAAE